MELRDHLKRLFVLSVLSFFITVGFALLNVDMQSRILHYNELTSSHYYSVLFSLFFSTTLILFIAYLLFLKSILTDRLEFRADDIIGTNRSEFRKFTKKLFNSDEYFTALNQALPKGQDDEDYGIDFIPFILESLRVQRDSFKRAARIYLVITSVLAFSFTGLLSYFGYLLIVTDSVGVSRSFNDLTSETKDLFEKIQEYKLAENINTNSSLERNLSDLQTKLDVVPRLLESVRPSADEQSGEYADSLIDMAIRRKNEIDQLIPEVETIEDLPPVLIKADSIHTIVDFWYFEDESEFSGFDKKLQYSIDKLVNQQTNFINFIPILERRLADIRSTTSSLDEKMEILKEKSALPDLLKRIAVGIIIGSFFLSIIRFSSGIYRKNFNEMVQCEQDSMNVRRLYVAMKNADDSNSKKLIIESLLSETNGAEKLRTDDSLKFNTDQLLQRLLRIIEKKI